MATRDNLRPVPSSAPVPGRYRHYKGNEYEVLGTARHSEDLDTFVVVYRPLETGELWVRPLDMFVGWVDRPEGTVRRFAPITE